MLYLTRRNDGSKNVFQSKHTNDIMVEFYKEAEGHRFFGLYALATPVYYVRDPDLIRRILVKDFDHFVDRQENQIEKVSSSKTDQVNSFHNAMMMLIQFLQKKPLYFKIRLILKKLF